MIKGLFNRFLKNSKQTQYVMLNWFQHLVKSMSHETLNQPVKQVQGMVQGDRSGLSTKPSMLKNSSKGFTLIEVVIVIVILSIVSAISIKFVADSLRIYTMTVNQKMLFDEAKLALERMCREIRDARDMTVPAAPFPSSGTVIRFRRTHATANDPAGEWIRFLQTGTDLQKDKATPNVTVTLASNVSVFTVTREANNEIRLQLTLYLASGESVTLETKVYPKNMPESTTYKTYFQNWEELRS